MSKLEQLHYSLGHLNYHAIKGMVYNPKGKATSASFPASKSSHADKVIGLIHSDLWGSAPVQTIIGTCYVITFVLLDMGCIFKTQEWCICCIQGVANLCGKQTGQQLLIFHINNKDKFITKK